MPRTKTENKDGFDASFLTEAIIKLNKAVDNLSQRLEEKPQLQVNKEDLTSHIPEYTSVEQLFPIPSAYFEMVNTILNKEFKIKVEPLADVPSFQFIVIVPPKYTNAPQEYLKMYKQDIRPKVIENALGIVGVRDWLEKVFNSFNPTIQAQIVADRMK